jgi:hypothetical protein
MMLVDEQATQKKEGSFFLAAGLVPHAEVCPEISWWLDPARAKQIFP